SATGEYVLTNVPVGTQRVRAEMIGFAPVEQSVSVVAGQAAQVDFQLSQVAISMDEIVVTGTAGAVSKRAIGNSVAKVDAASVTERTTISTLTELLQAKTPGLALLPNSG